MTKRLSDEWREQETWRINMGLQGLECGHCGWVAISNPDGMYRDGEGERCDHCGLRGNVSLCTETLPHWVHSEDPEDKCQLVDCLECGGLR